MTGKNASSRLDVLILGNGPAGSSAAVALLRRGYRVGLAGVGSPRNFKIGESLPPAANRIVADLGFENCIEPGDHLVSSGTLSSWGSPDVGVVDFVNDPNGLGWHLDRARFDESLCDRACDEGAVPFPEIQMKSLRKIEEGWDIRFKDQSIVAYWIVDASGRAGRFASSLGSRRRQYGNQICIYCLFDQRSHTPADADGRALVESVRDGWWYSALLPSRSTGDDRSSGNHRIVAWFSDADLVPREFKGRPGLFLEKVSETRVLEACLRINQYEIFGSPKVTNAQAFQRTPPYGDGWLATGDAAMAFDPVASQGITNALIAGSAAGEAIAACIEGDTESLVVYGRWLDSIFEAYLDNVREVYLREQRWSEAPFWKRRHQR